MTQRGKSDREQAAELLQVLVSQGINFGPDVALELAAMLCHLAGGDGRGVYSITHDPEGDRIR